ncbi:hypothetical protein [Algoriphagus sp.]|uniref:hypothetical protein n=1 Tax=Algoriphagus sp. TaxID=1872435 RepID=UPI0026162BB2|nr:hypothetical protein [Algoriphagus sp.]
MKTSKVVFFLFWISGMLSACLNEENETLFEFYWDQTYCADPWGNSGKGNSALRLALEEYLIEKGILGASISFSTEEERRQACFACHCTSGIRIYIQVPFQFRDQLVELGFKEVE